MKKGILKTVEMMWFEPQEFGVSGLPQGEAWSFERAVQVMRQSDGALILALARWLTPEEDKDFPVPTEYSHFEGALAIGEGLPTLVIGEAGMKMRGILLGIGGLHPVMVPMDDADLWLRENRLLGEPSFRRWVELVRGRYDLFFGYCSKAASLAKSIKGYLETNGLTVFDWATGVRPGRSIMEEVTRAALTCRWGLFLFTAEGPLETGETATSVPRDNVLLEAGYFMSAHGSSRVVIVKEKGTKMPSDLGGIIYLTLDDRNSWQEVAEQVAQSIGQQITSDFA